MALTPMLSRIVAGFVVALAIALAAHRAGSLSRSGAVAATFVGTAAVSAGWAWGVVLVVYFVTSSALSHFRQREKKRRTAGIVEKGGERDALQVIANGGVFGVALALAGFASPHTASALSLGALGALASAAADAWATEIGTLFGGIPRSVRTLKPAQAGTSGAVSVVGTLANLRRAMVAALASLLHLTTAPALVLVAGALGALADTALGATLQERRWCASCERSTERTIHDCGSTTQHASGLRWMTNDVVNLGATVVGFGVAVLGLIING